FSELVDARRFDGSTLNYNTLLLEDRLGILYVGARGAIFALNTSDITDGFKKTISWQAPPWKRKECQDKGKNDEQTECFNHIRFLQRFNETHLYTCGTYAFAPLCAYIDIENFTLPSKFDEGKEKCPYDPEKGYTAVLVDGEMYSATRYEFKNTPDIKRSERVLRTEDWLNEANFVGSALVRESRNSSIGDDDKLYFFFTEQTEEESAYYGKPQVTRVARVCKNDLGGKRILLRKWTSFLKARLVCSIPDYGFHFNVLKSIYVLDQGSWDTTVFYGVFTSQWGNVKNSAVCQYDIADVRAAFEGPYMEYLEASQKWSRYTGEVPRPRPGSCITDTSRRAGFSTSKDLPDAVLTFLKKHTLMHMEVNPVRKRPLLLKRNVIYTRVAVHRVTALNNRQYQMVLLGTSDGWVHKAVEIGSQVHVIEEIQLFKDSQPVESLVVSQTQRSLYAGSQSGVVQLPLASCSKYTTCYDCVFARDPYCGWDGEACIDVAMAKNRSLMIQDLENRNPYCLNSFAHAPQRFPPRKKRTVLKGDDILLTCNLVSNLATTRWTLNGEEISAGGRYKVGADGLLVIDSDLLHSGNYCCHAEENGARHLVARYTVNVLPELPKLEPSAGPAQSPLPLPPKPEPQAMHGMTFIYVTLIAFLGGMCLVLSVVLLYIFWSQGRKATYRFGSAKHMGVELRTISGGSAPKAEGGGPGEYSDGLLQIIPGEDKHLPPPPPPPPLPTELTNGISSLPSVLRKMNGNNYVLLQQSEENSSPLYYSFTEELNKILEKRKKHTQLVEKPDESSV
uniref:Semaphorin 4G n=1 Tax=Latimeria chalumnae TaxID=7897 RepID=H3AC58_LATCH